jgi:putative ABC transport system substrate-binding protein
MNRRQFISFVGSATVVWPLETRAQRASKMPIIGVLWHAANEEEEGIYLTSLRQGFQDLGYREGSNLRLENRDAAERYEKFATDAAELVALKVDVLVAVTRPAAEAAQRATSTIPIVFLFVPDPVGMKFVTSLGRPGGNITGLTQMADIIGKRLEIFKEALPGLSRVALLVNPSDPPLAKRNIDDVRRAAGRLRIEIHEVNVRGPEDFEGAFAVIDELRAEGVFTGIDPMIYNKRKLIA